MNRLGVSVIVVSHGRPELLATCVRGIEQLLYPAIELIVVADEAGIAAVQALDLPGQMRLIPFDEANISVARNTGLAVASGEVVAFIDDDAVPEPTWLSALVQPFANPDVVAAGGFVRGRNGISWQWKARSVDRMGEALPLDVDEEQTSLLTPTGERAIKTEGTNMAFRRDILTNLGGFDPAFRFYLDETDVNLRLAALGRMTAIVPSAEVHHGFAASTRRRDDRVPKSLFEIGASTAVFLRKHTPDEVEQGLKRLQKEQRQRLLRHMVAGRLEPGDVRRLMRDLRAGIKDGRARDIKPLQPIIRRAEAFLPFETFPAATSMLVSGRRSSLAGQIEGAMATVQERKRVTVMSYSATAAYHRVGFDPRGFWVHRGGIFGRCERREPLWRLSSLARRVRAECGRIAKQRNLDP